MVSINARKIRLNTSICSMSWLFCAIIYVTRQMQDALTNVARASPHAF